MFTKKPNLSASKEKKEIENEQFHPKCVYFDTFKYLFYKNCNTTKKETSFIKTINSYLSYQQLHIEELVTLCQQQNQKAQFEVYNRYCKAMYNVAFRMVKDEHFAEDVMQESFLKAFTKIDSYKKEVAFGAWLKRIVINYSIDFCKKNNKLKGDDFEKNLYKIEDKETEFTEVVNFDEIKIKEVLNAIQSLKTSYSTVLTLFYIEGYDQEEISEILKISYANCRTTLSRAKESLRNKLSEYDK